MLSLLAAPTRRIRSFVLCVVVLQTIFVIAQEAVGNFQLALARQYGRHGFRECRLDIVVFEGNGAAELHCALNSRNAKGEEPPPLKAREINHISGETTVGTGSGFSALRWWPRWT